MDTLRADALGAYGANGGSTPHMDALAARSMLFEKAFATAPFTGPSHASMLTGQHPSRHGVVYNGHRVAKTIADESPVLSELLLERGYATKGVVSTVVLDPKFGFARGFDSYERGCRSDHRDAGSDGSCVTAAALEWLEKRDPSQAFFLWVHYADPHFPYLVSEETRKKLALPAEAMIGHPLSNAKRRPREEVRRAYQADVFEADLHVGTLLSGLEKLELTDSTVVALVSDHGEYLGEHGLYEHHDTYDEVLHVPMMLSIPGRTAERRREQVSIIDLLPSILDGLGMEAPEGVQGLSLLDPKSKAHGRPVYAEWRNYSIVRGGKTKPGDFQIAVRTPGEKFVLDLLYPQDGSRFFDLAADPREHRNLIRQRPPQLAKLEELLKHHREHDVDDTLLRPTRLQMSDEDIEMLRALGYAE